MHRRRFLALSLFLIGALAAFAQQTVKVAFIEDNFLYREVSLGQSYLQHVIDVMERYSGLKIEIVPIAEQEAVSALKDGRIDVLPFSQHDSPEFLYSDIPSAIGHMIIASDKLDDDFQTIGLFDTRQPFGDSPLLNDAAPLYFHSRSEMYKALRAHEIDAFVDSDLVTPPGYRSIEVLNPIYYYIAVSPQNMALFKQINTSFSLAYQLDNGSYGSFINHISPRARYDWLSHTPEEEAYIAHKKSLTIAVLDNTPPFSYVENGKLKGMSIDTFASLSTRMGLAITYVTAQSYAEAWALLSDGTADALFAACGLSAESKKYYQLSSPYIQASIIMLSPQNPNEIASSEHVVVLPETYRYFEPMLHSFTGEAQFEYKKSMKDCLDALRRDNKAITFLSDFENMYYENHYQNGLFSQLPLGMPVSTSLVIKKQAGNQVLLSVLDKAIAGIERHEIERSFLTYIDEENERIFTRYIVRHPKRSVLIAAILVLFITSGSFYFVIRCIRAKKNKLIMQITDRANRDSMTGLYNRIAYKNIVDGMLEKRTGSERTTSALLMIDIDKFKTINDTLGHSVGDEVIITVANTLTKFFRYNDVVCRMGGDEFSVFLPRTFNKLLMTERLEALVKEFSVVFSPEKYAVPVTCSIGAAMAKGDSTFESLYLRADGALYSVKENGRNSFNFAD